MVNNFDQTEIETAVGDVIYSLGVSGNVFANRPSSSQRDLSDFVVCKVTGAVSDLRAIGRCTLSVHLFARDAANMKNGKKLSAMQGKLIGGMPRSIGRISIDDTPRIVGDTSDGYGYHVRIINYDLILKTA